ncbi:hypothetical protein K1719_005924 [Acacia pycnantha]|nr:hypothetical protein K1719_005924 [Acacia pycnantha]
MRYHGSKEKPPNGTFHFLTSPLNKANIDCCRFLEKLMGPEKKYTEVITAFWAIEAVYQESFAHIATRRLKRASDDQLKTSELALLTVLELEVEFWNMSRVNS